MVLARTRTAWHRSDRRRAVGAAVAYVAVGVAARRVPSRPERRSFNALNHSGGELHLLRLPQQLGTPWVLPLLGGYGFVTNRPHLAAYGALALPLEKGMEVGLKFVLRRKRPFVVEEDVEIRDDAPTEGPSYPSGHGAIAFTAVGITQPYVHPAVTAAAAGTATVTSLVRIHQGAHWPMDAVGGALLGIAVAATLRTIVGVPAGPRRARVRARVRVGG